MLENDDFIPFSRPYIEDGDVEAVAEVIYSGWWTTGPRVREFETQFARYVGAKHAVALNSCTAALHVAMAAVGVERGDLVLLPSYTFASTAEAVLYMDAVPVLLDIDPQTMNMDVGQLKVALEVLSASDRGSAVSDAENSGALRPGTARVISQVAGRPRAIVPVHFAGKACEMDEIVSLAQRHDLRIVEDAAHAVETLSKSKKVGSIGDVTAFSFYSTKNLSTGEGGMATTNHADLAERMRRLSLHGISRDAWNRYSSAGSWYYEILEQGYKYNMTDIAAALGLRQLMRIDRMAARRQEIAGIYAEKLKSLDALELPRDDEAGVHAWHLYVIRLRAEMLSIGRGEFIEELRNKGIGTSVHFIPLHMHPFYADKWGYLRGDFPVSEDSYDRALSLPLYPGLSDEDVFRVCDAVRVVCEEHAE